MTVINSTETRRRIVQKSIRKSCKKVCSVKSVKSLLPITTWLPKYNITLLIQDIIAGITVGLTAIPQGIAYAIVAGLPPEYGLYAGLMGGIVYLFFGSCKDITIGPTAILSAMTAKYVSDYSYDYAILVAFLSGWVILTMGVMNLGFLVEFISIPVISGFTTAAALQIASAQLISLFGMEGKSGNYFSESIISFFKNITTINIRDSVLGIITILMLLVLKRIGEGCSRTDGVVKQLRWFISIGRNAVVVIIGIIIAYSLKVTTGEEPLRIIGEIGSGLPTIQSPPFSTVVGNETHNFIDMLQTIGPGSIILPLVAILELIAIAKAFAGGAEVNATQEMIALGLCNIIGSFALSMPITGSFTRTALNNASGVQTTAGGIFTAILILLALSLLTSTFYYIPKASLAGLIITAMFYMIDYKIFIRLWKTSKRELFYFIATICVCLVLGLEYGIVAGVIIDALVLLFTSARPSLEVNNIIETKGYVCIIIRLPESLPYCAADHLRRKILKISFGAECDTFIIIDGVVLRKMDSTVASNLMSLIKDVEKSNVKILFLNFDNYFKDMCNMINPKYSNKFLTCCSDNIEDIVEITVKTSV
ncbi:sodium-independent sulfate anion transporter-like [Melitaea cinxia]|uniref:sodium-independent sulfate anion transporter-like n=1 Tax=Melitaea cinxia TaxID=113334 RepID=UPI001E271CFE|nr:sodium-independent sulfate anion transporter-like [Melitaea cinxia]